MEAANIVPLHPQVRLEGDRIVIDLPGRRIDLEVDEPEVERRRREWHPSPARYPSGALAKYARLVGSAEHGAVTG